MTFGRVSESAQLKAVLRTLGTIDKGLAKEWRRRAKTEIAEPWAAELAAQAPGGSLGAAAGRSIKAGTGAMPVLWAGKGQWNGWQPYFVLEFGGQKLAKVTYVNRQRTTKSRYVIRRRTTMQFEPHRGREGIWMFPYWRRNEAHLRNRVIRLMDDFIEEHLT
jgi:hypothetical protein